jgi:hypothetical protein
VSLGLVSEVGTLRGVIVHRPRLAPTRVTPNNADKVIWVQRAEGEHDAFVSVMRHRGVEVLDPEVLVKDVLEVPEARAWVRDRVLDECDGVLVQTPDDSTKRIRARTVVWAAGIRASTLACENAQQTGAEVDDAGRSSVERDPTLSGHPEVIAFGDMVRVRAGTGEPKPLPGVAPVAIQQGRYVGRIVRERLRGRETRPFRYRDKGNPATIGRARAVADLRVVRLAGPPAWLGWVPVHLWYLIGFQNRLLVMTRLAFSFATRGSGARLITGIGFDRFARPGEVPAVVESS